MSVTRVFFVLSLFCAPLLLTVVDVERCPATEAWAAMGTANDRGPRLEMTHHITLYGSTEKDLFEQRCKYRNGYGTYESMRESVELYLKDILQRETLHKDVQREH